MDYPEFIAGFPGLDTPFPEDAVSTHAIRSDAGLVVFFTVHKDLAIAEHSHGPQWGTIFAGHVQLTIDGVLHDYKPGDAWDIPAGTPHSVKLFAGSRLMDVFAEPDRYPFRA